MSTFARSAASACLFLAAFAARDASALGKRSQYGRPCAAVLGAESAAGSAFATAIRRMDARKSVLLPDAVVKDQGQYGCCWISSAVARYERLILDKFGRRIEISEDHLVLASIFYRTEEALYFGDDVSEGGWTMTSDWMIRNVGLVPASEWAKTSARYPNRPDFRDPKVGVALLKELNAEIETVLARLATRREGLANPPTADQLKILWAEVEKEKLALFEKIRERMGNFPSHFEIDGKTYTPISFADAVMPNREKEILLLVSPEEKRLHVWSEKSSPKNSLAPEKSAFGLYPELKPYARSLSSRYEDPTGDPQAYRLLYRSLAYGFDEGTAKLAGVHQLIIGKLREGKPVYIHTAMVDAYIDGRAGIFSIRAKGHTLEQATGAVADGAHAMLITGAYLDAEGKLIGYHLQNSWGAEIGKSGYFFMDRDYFDAFADGIVTPMASRLPRAATAPAGTPTAKRR